MNMLSNETLFYGGLITAGIAAAALLVFAVLSIAVKIKLNAKFDVEYGERTDKKKKTQAKKEGI